ncbi:hypothetical protein B0H19DRAFT_1071322 [Mycena capillaripes]|nr:hypothetical protein B0H19DRAFT_1071322 [Mycena capillaripes]
MDQGVEKRGKKNARRSNLRPNVGESVILGRIHKFSSQKESSRSRRASRWGCSVVILKASRADQNVVETTGFSGNSAGTQVWNLGRGHSVRTWDSKSERIGLFHPATSYYIRRFKQVNNPSMRWLNTWMKGSNPRGISDFCALRVNFDTVIFC